MPAYNVSRMKDKRLSGLINGRMLLTACACFLLAGCSSSSNTTSTTPVTPTAPAPTFSPAGGAFSATQSVTLSDSLSGATIYYTTDGSAPTTSATRYTAPLSVLATQTINAIAAASGYNNSAAADATYTITLPAASAPQFSPAAGSYVSAQTVTLSDTTTGATIYYTTDGSAPTTNSTKYTAPITVAYGTTINAIAMAAGYTSSTVASSAYVITGNPVAVNVVLSTHDQATLMAPQSAINFALNAPSSNPTVIDESQTYQTIDGFGAAFTDSAAYLLEQVASTPSTSSTLNDLFTRNGNGIGLSFMRLPMGASDIARSVYSYDDMPSGQTDATLANFSIAHDQAYIVPLVAAAKKLNPQMKIMATPWSPPGWMKSSGSLIGGTLLPTMYAPFANYFVKFIQAYGAAGVPIDYISLQNEPLYSPASYPGMGMDSGAQTTVLRDYVLPALTSNHLTTQVLVYDHNWDNTAFALSVLNDPVILASPLVAGSAWHGYGGVAGAQLAVANAYPTKGTWQTEHSGGTWVTDQFTSDFLEITNVLRSSGKGYIKWSLALDQNRGPNLSNLSGYGGCNTCTPIVTVNTSGAVTRTVEYYTLGHYSKYILPGATRVYSSNGTSIATAAFVNPDASRVLFAFNNSSAPQTFQAQWGVQSFSYTLPAFGAATFTWQGTPTGSANLQATTQIQASSFSSMSGIETENTSDTTGAYDLGYVNSNAWAAYKNVAFGSTSPSKVQVRSASAGNGGTLEFHLDSTAGPLIATATLPVTGGWQSYQTVSASVNGATGVHDLYIVFKGSGGIANLNWFQFQ